MENNYIVFIAFSVVIMMALYLSRDWLGKALSDDNSPSTKRLVGFMFATVVCVCEIYATLKQQSFNDKHLYACLVAIILCLGIATMPQLLEAWKGIKSEENK